MIEAEEKLSDGFVVKHLITKKVETKKRRLFFEVFNNLESDSFLGILYLDLRTIMGVKVTLLSVPVESIKSRERFIFYIDVPKSQASFKKVGWFFDFETSNYFGETKNSGKFDDLVAYQKQIDKLKG
jgi:hypothetical protein